MNDSAQTASMFRDPSSYRRLGWIKGCAGACAWTAAAGAFAAALLALFVLLVEPGGRPLLDTLAQPLNVTRLVLMTASLALWAYIVPRRRDGAGQPHPTRQARR